MCVCAPKLTPDTHTQYGGVADAKTDNGKAITDAWTACAAGGQVLIPAGDYGLGTWVVLRKGAGVAVNIEGTIYRTGTDEGTMISIEHSSDIEVYSATSAGAIQGYGYQMHGDGASGPRLVRCTKCSDFSIHDLILVDAPLFHLSIDTGANGEIYNMVVHGGYMGGLDGIDVWGTNICECSTSREGREYPLTQGLVRGPRCRGLQQGRVCDGEESCE